MPTAGPFGVARDLDPQPRHRSPASGDPKAGTRGATRGHDALPALTAGPEECSATTELRHLVQRALALLTPEQRQVIELAYYSGLSHNEIAAKLGQPLGTVKTRIRTGMMLLREDLRSLLPEAQP